MSKVKLYVIRDLVAGECGPVFCAVNDGVAIRQSCILMHDVIDINDYVLVRVGTFDSESMEIENDYFEVDFRSVYALYCAKIEERKAKEMFITGVEK
nr:MAG: nonstructural protein [Microvirus sp.]